MNKRYKVGSKVMINISCHSDGKYFSVNDDMLTLDVASKMTMENE